MLSQHLFQQIVVSFLGIQHGSIRQLQNQPYESWIEKELARFLVIKFANVL